MTETGTVDDLGGGAALDEPEAGAGPSSPAPAEPTPAGDRDGGPGRGRTALTIAVLTAVVALPIVIATISVRSPRWYPLVDLAQIEMRVRDVGFQHPPLVGMGGRIFGLAVQGSHPGPVSFYLLAPVYRLFGSSSWALVVSDSVINIAVIAATLWAAHRRMGLRGALLVAAGLAFVMRVYGTALLVYPWNPWMPILFWFLFLVCAWGVLCGDLVLLPVAVLAGTMCAQTHIPYVALVGGLSLVIIGSLVRTFRHRKGDRAARRSLLRWTGASALLALVLWLPVFIEQVGGNPGNVAVLIDSFRYPTDSPIGLSRAWGLWLQHMDVFHFLRGDAALTGSSAPGLILLALWLAAVVVAVRLRERTLVALHVVTGVALGLGLLAISRIFGPPWDYLMLWAWGTAAVAGVAVVATGAALFTRLAARRSEGDRARLARVAWVPTATLAVLVVLPTLSSAHRAPDTRERDMDLSDDLSHVMGPTLRAVRNGEVAGARDGVVLVSWTDPYNLGGQGFGLMLELERQGYDARAGRGSRLAVRSHRVVQASADADAELHLAVGEGAIAEAGKHEGAVRLAFYDPRSPEEKAAYEQARSDLVTSLRATGLSHLVGEIDSNFFGLGTDSRLSTAQKTTIAAMSHIRPPLAVFSWDPQTDPPQ